MARGGGELAVGESLPVIWGGVLHLAGSWVSLSVFSSSPGVLLRILAMFSTAKVPRFLLLTLGMPCLELSRGLPAAPLAVWGASRWGGGVIVQAVTGSPGRSPQTRLPPSASWS